MKRMGLWFWLLTKRLYKKPVFLAILVLIPLLTLCYRAAAQQESSMVTVALAREGDSALAERVMEDLQTGTGVIRYHRCSGEEARVLVETGKVDAAWIFPADMEEKMARFLEDPSQDNAFVQVLQREENVAHMLTRERLGGAVSHELFREIYLQFIRERFPELDRVSDGELLQDFDSYQMDGQLFTYETLTGQKAPDTHYLLSPVRGILGVMGVLCGMAAAMYHQKDRQRGMFVWMSPWQCPLAELAGQTVAVGNVMLVALVTLALTGLQGPVFTELAVLVLYTLCTAVFSMLLGSVLGSVGALGVTLPLLSVTMLLVCPVFLDLAKLRLLQFLLPPTYYINAIHNPAYLGYMAIFTAICAALYLLSEKLRKRL